MHSSVRTYDPTEANMFYVPTFMYEWTGESANGCFFMCKWTGGGQWTGEWKSGWVRRGRLASWLTRGASGSGCFLARSLERLG